MLPPTVPEMSAVPRSTPLPSPSLETLIPMLERLEVPSPSLPPTTRLTSRATRSGGAHPLAAAFSRPALPTALPTPCLEPSPLSTDRQSTSTSSRQALRSHQAPPRFLCTLPTQRVSPRVCTSLSPRTDRTRTAVRARQQRLPVSEPPPPRRTTTTEWSLRVSPLFRTPELPSLLWWVLPLEAPPSCSSECSSTGTLCAAACA
mmetsp:Transcript_54290/g.106239  ORF Transcript_54290/g.106239 Transcript_54290/m.106239 type:complete len:203 (-) Transcript_54290:383-991(-)